MLYPIHIVIVVILVKRYLSRRTMMSAWVRKREYEIFAVKFKNLLSRKFPIYRVKGREIMRMAMSPGTQGKW